MVSCKHQLSLRRVRTEQPSVSNSVKGDDVLGELLQEMRGGVSS